MGDVSLQFYDLFLVNSLQKIDGLATKTRKLSKLTITNLNYRLLPELCTPTLLDFQILKA